MIPKCLSISCMKAGSFTAGLNDSMLVMKVRMYPFLVTWSLFAQTAEQHVGKIKVYIFGILQCVI